MRASARMGVATQRFTLAAKKQAVASRAAWNQYADGFSAERFVDVIERGAVWGMRN